MVSSSNGPKSWSRALVLTASLLASTSRLAAAQSSSYASSASAHVSESSNASTSAAAATASSSSTSTATSTNPLIPNSISSKCHSFLASLNGDSHISACTTPLLSALESFQASSSLNSYSPASSSAVAETLATFCAAPSCDDSRIRSLLNQFNGNCSTELQAGNDVVLGSYDSLYLLTPLKQSICEEDGAGGYCLIDIAKGDVPSSSSATSIASVVNASSSASASSSVASASASSLAVNSTGSEKFIMLAASTSSSIEAPAPPSLYIQITSVAKRLLRRQQSAAESWSGSSSGSYSASASSQASPSGSAATGNSTSSSSNSTSASTFKLPSVLPNSQTYRSMSLPFLFLSSSLPSTTLCTPCTKQILTNYISFESRQPYALGLANSPILGGQGELWQGTGEKCGSGFLSNIMQMSGQQELTGAASALQPTGLKLAAVAVAGAVGWFALMV
ncbi:hypothetical protein JCM3766R1_007156 [Sporobolomyces carnicolor]